MPTALSVRPPWSREPIDNLRETGAVRVLGKGMDRAHEGRRSPFLPEPE